MRQIQAARVLDVAAVLSFVLIGRASHHHGEGAAGIARTLWPFLLAMAIGWFAVRQLPIESLRIGGVVALTTVVVGMSLRVIAGQGTAVAFVVVAVAYLGATMVGGRRLMERARARWRRS